jgi:hypothetical protein
MTAQYRHNQPVTYQGMPATVQSYIGHGYWLIWIKAEDWTGDTDKVRHGRVSLNVLESEIE